METSTVVITIIFGIAVLAGSAFGLAWIVRKAARAKSFEAEADARRRMGEVDSDRDLPHTARMLRRDHF
jgi:hypothetical protein